MALSMLAVSLAAAAATPDMRVVFQNGSPAPGLPSGFTYNFVRVLLAVGGCMGWGRCCCC